MNWNNAASSIFDDNNILSHIQQEHGHCLYYNPAVDINSIQNTDFLQDICLTANSWLDKTLEVSDNFKARLVNINRFAQTLVTTGCAKPLLLHYRGSMPFTAGTGGTRLLAAEVLPSVTTLPAFISTNVQHNTIFSGLEEITTITRFRELCHAPRGEIRMQLDSDNEIGIIWYEVDSPDRSIAVYSDESTVAALGQYLKAQTAEFRFEPKWFASAIDWSGYFV